MKTKLQSLSRRERKVIRKDKMRQLTAIMKKIYIEFKGDPIPQYQQIFPIVWPALRLLLDIVEDSSWTGEKTDIALENIIDLGDRIASGNNTPHDITLFLENLLRVWKRIRFVLEVMMIFTRSQTDEVIEKVIRLGDWISGYEQDRLAA